MARCLIGCGSNLGSRRQQIQTALDLLRYMPGVELLAVSRFRETRPVGGPARQGSFLNGACLIETDLPPGDLLGALCAVENTLARRRDERWGPRTIDLDLLLYGDLVVESPELTLPHPRMATRRFVLEPCAEIAGELPHPVAGCTVRELLDNISVPHPLVAVVGIPGSGSTEVATAVADATLARLIRAPRPLPLGPGDAGDGEDHARRPGEAPSAVEIAPWRDLVAAWREPLVTESWEEDPQGTILDYSLDLARAAAAEALRPASWSGFDASFVEAAAGSVAPHVAIFLELSGPALRNRLDDRRRAAGSSDRLADLDAFVFARGGSAGEERRSDADTVARLMRLQDRLGRRLRCPAERCPRGPKAVISIPADDLGRAAAEATAAVEAMLG
jgi:2-amino-4-hydroxy-6-hydroxymethyldihydropteridine diphosphokinase